MPVVQATRGPRVALPFSRFAPCVSGDSRRVSSLLRRVSTLGSTARGPRLVGGGCFFARALHRGSSSAPRVNPKAVRGQGSLNLRGISSVSSSPVSIDKPLTRGALRRIMDGERITVPESVYRLLDKRRHEIPAGTYGYDSGFAAAAGQSVSDTSQVSNKLRDTHAVGFGAPLSGTSQRLMVGLLIRKLVQGYSGVSSDLLRKIVHFYNSGVEFEVPKIGTCGASGDLSPLAHFLMGCAGKGWIKHPQTGKWVAPKEGLSAHFPGENIEHLLIRDLGPLEGIGVMNGTHFVTGVAVQSLLEFEDLGVPMNSEDRFFLDSMWQIALDESNSVSSNPVYDPKTKTYISAGHFHAQYPAHISDRLSCFVFERLKAVVVESGIDAVSMEQLLKAHSLSKPSSVRTRNTGGDQEDHVSMGGQAARRALEAVRHARTVPACAKPVLFRRGVSSEELAGLRQTIKNIHHLLNETLKVQSLAMAAQGFSLAPFTDAANRVKLHQGQKEVAAQLLKMSGVKEDDVFGGGAESKDAQTPYTSRCLPQVLGPTLEALQTAVQWLEQPEQSKMGLACVKHMLFMVAHEISSVTERHLDRLMKPHFTGLEVFLGYKPGDSGVMMHQYAAAAGTEESSDESGRAGSPDKTVYIAERTVSAFALATRFLVQQKVEKGQLDLSSFSPELRATYEGYASVVPPMKGDREFLKDRHALEAYMGFSVG